MAAMADSMMAAAVWEEAGWGRFVGEDMVAGARMKRGEKSST